MTTTTQKKTPVSTQPPIADMLIHTGLITPNDHCVWSFFFNNWQICIWIRSQVSSAVVTNCLRSQGNTGAVRIGLWIHQVDGTRHNVTIIGHCMYKCCPHRLDNVLMCKCCVHSSLPPKKLQYITAGSVPVSFSLLCFSRLGQNYNTVCT